MLSQAPAAANVVPGKAIPKHLPPSAIAHVPTLAVEREQMARSEKDKGNECYQVTDIVTVIISVLFFLFYSFSPSVESILTIRS